jgi:hypothetical protein
MNDQESEDFKAYLYRLEELDVIRELVMKMAKAGMSFENSSAIANLKEENPNG